MLSFAAGRPWLSTIRIRLLDRANPRRAAQNAAWCFCQEHPGTLRVGQVLAYGETSDAEITELLVTPESLVLLDGEGTVTLEIPHERVRDVQCGQPVGDHDRHLPQNEEHLFVTFEDDAGQVARLEISLGALDDVGPVRQMRDCLQSRVGLGGTAPHG